jgi:hypothetical protein
MRSYACVLAVAVFVSNLTLAQEAKRSEDQNKEATSLTTEKGLFTKRKETRPPEATIQDFDWSITRSDLRKSYGHFYDKKWIEANSRTIDEKRGHSWHEIPRLKYGDLRTTVDFEGEKVFAVQLQSMKFDTLEPEPFQINDWKGLKTDLESRLGHPDDDKISASDQKIRVYYYRQWRFPKVDRVVELRLYKVAIDLSGGGKFDKEYSHVLVKKPSVNLIPMSFLPGPSK